jgi:hypothetical protein
MIAFDVNWLAAPLRRRPAKQDNQRLERISRFVAGPSRVVQSSVWMEHYGGPWNADGGLCAD